MKWIGVTDDVTTCECCGKANLKRTVVLSIDDATVYYGVDCAARALRQASGDRLTSAVANKRADVIAYAQHLLKSKRYTKQQIADAVWNRFGFSVTVKGDALHLSTFAVIR